MKYWQDKDFPGFDIGGTYISNVPDVEACAKLCLSKTNCQAITYKDSEKRCWNKANSDPTKWVANTLAGFKSGIRCNANFPPEPTEPVAGFYPHLGKFFTLGDFRHTELNFI